VSITIHEGSILNVEADVIVNPANGFLNHGAGLARIIADADRSGAIWAASRATPTLPVGGATATTAGDLPFEAVIHAVGPAWGGGDYHEDALLRLAHVNTLDLCRMNDWRSVVFPAVSCGLFNFPPYRAAKIALGAVLAHGEGIDVTFALMEAEHVEAWTDAAAFHDIAPART
jgi:O-acetyl-ADP-ribose deacetylase (regulator of RNase III)